MNMCYKIFTPLGYKVLLAKNNVQDQNWEGAGLGEHPKIWDPLCISATVEASNFKFGTQLGFRTSLPKNYVLVQNRRGNWPGEHPKKLGPLRIFAIVEASNFKFGTQIGFGTSLPKKRRLGPKLGVLARDASQKIWDPYLFLQRNR